jgi:hypothetical protein
VIFAEKLEGFVGWRASLVDKVVDPLLSSHQLFVSLITAAAYGLSFRLLPCRARDTR